MHKVAVIVGSLRRDSVNRTFARALQKLAQGKLEFSFVELDDLPMYNEDLWASPPPGVLRLKRQVEAADAVLFVTPEYNRSVPAVLKNAIDWGTRPWGKNSWAGKPAAVVGTSPGAIGTAVAQSQLRDVAAVVGTILMVQPEVYFVMKDGLIDASFDVTDEGSREFLEGWVAAFASWIVQVSPQIEATEAA